MKENIKENIRDFTLEELMLKAGELGEPGHRGRQIFAWLYGKGARAFSEMTDLPRGFIRALENRFSIAGLEPAGELQSKDGAEKILWKLRDGKYVESVLIKGKKRYTLCVSTQAGCKFGCPFCASGKKGFKRNLTSGEIAEQAVLVRKMKGIRLTNIVFMGMGEPLDNYDNLIKAVRVLNHPAGPGIGARKITVSTCGIIPGILKLKNEGIQVELSVSLHASNDELRDELVPVNRKYPLDKLTDACAKYSEATGRVITLEYVLLRDKNDSLKDADKLAKIAKKLGAKVNLIECNPMPGGEKLKPEAKRSLMFQDRLILKGVNVTMRRSRGSEIKAACGQLAAEAGDA